jgi:hypothetical protein
MKPLPDLSNSPAMIDRGKRSALGSSRNEAAEALRDACTLVQSAKWEDLYSRAAQAHEAAERLMTIAALWNEL